MASPLSDAPTRRSRGFSLRSDKPQSRRSSRSNSSALLETSDERAKRKLKTKADPLLAMSEAQPMHVAFEKSNLASLRAMAHKDQYGNLITDPDLSNPTRSRFERPLETIRSFEAAIYATYSGRSLSAVKQDDEGEYSRRGSYYEASKPFNGNRNDQNTYNGHGNWSRPASYIDAHVSNQQFESYYPYNQDARPRQARHSPRRNMEQTAYGGHQNGYQQYGPASAASGDSWSGANGQTNHGDQGQQIYVRTTAEYGFQGAGGQGYDQNMSQASTNTGANNPASSRGSHGRPSPMYTFSKPAGDESAATSAGRLQQTAVSSVAGEKQKSWFKKRFSKH